MFATFAIFASSCVSRAPTDCELDKRSGLYPSSFCSSRNKDSKEKNISESRSNSNSRPSESPVRSQPVVKKIWVHDQILDGGHYMAGTWMFIEVEPSQWLGTVSNTPSAERKITAIPVETGATNIASKQHLRPQQKRKIASNSRRKK